MRFIKRSARKSPRVSLVLLDWSVRESFHLLHYLTQQTVARDDFEVIVIEYYSRVSEALKRFEDQVDTWLILDVPENCYYHKHLMYNAGIVVANGDIVMIGDSDAMVKPTFIETIIRSFDQDPKIVYHIDQFRNLRRDFYPFSYPSFEDVLGEGCINNVGGKTAGVLNTEDPIHSRNYGACMCAKKADMIAIGGADMHIDYLGHICGPYDMTFRLVNYGLREIWDQEEFTYHTWHPGQAGADNYLGPHDGRHMSTTALEALASGRIAPFAESEAIRLIRTGEAHSPDEALRSLIPAGIAQNWDLKYVEANASHLRFSNYRVPLGTFKGFRIVSEFGRIVAYPLGDRRDELEGSATAPPFEGATEEEIKSLISKDASPMSVALSWLTSLFAMPFSLFHFVYRYAQLLPLSVSSRAKALIGLLGAPLTFVAAVLFVPAPLIAKLRRLRRDNLSSAEKLDNIVATLNNLNKWGSLKSSDELPMILADRLHTIYFLRLLQLLGVIPRIIIRHASNIERVQAALAELDNHGWSGQLLVPADLFSRFHAAIGPAIGAQRLVVI